MVQRFPAEEGLDFSKPFIVAKQIKSLKATNLNQPDLYYFDSILVSTGVNDNDVWFTAQELWEAKSSPVDKPLNMEHNEDYVVGHITECRATTFEGEDIKEESFPEEFDLTVKSVLYSYRSDDDRQKQVHELIGQISQGMWFVSMETLYDDFDYFLMDDEGKKEVVARNESSSYLSKHLRAFNGEGKYEGKTVGIIPKKLLFNGMGLTRNPANSRSVILKSSASVYSDSSDSVSSNNTDSQMEELQKQFDALKAEYDALVPEHTSVKEALAAKETALGELTASLEDLKQSYAALQVEHRTASEELTSLKAKILLDTRTGVLASVLGLPKEEAEESAKLLSSLSDEAFNGHVENLKKHSAKASVDSAAQIVRTEPVATPTPKFDAPKQNNDDLKSAFSQFLSAN